jgi:hypothetical protein
MMGTKSGGNASAVSSITAGETGAWQLDCAGFPLTALVATAVMTGSAGVVLNASSAGTDVNVVGGNVAKETGGNLASILAKLTQGAQAIGASLAVNPATASTWDIADRAARLVGIVYGSLGQIAQKAAATPAVAGDTAVVTDVRPGGVFPAAAALADNDAVPSATSIGVAARGLNLARTGLVTIQTGFTTFTTSVLGWVNTIPTILYNASPVARTEGQYSPPQGDLYGNQKVAESYSPNYEDNTNSVATTAVRYLANGAYSPGLLTSDYGATITKNAKAAAGLLTQAVGKNRNVGTRWLQFHNTATTPSAAAVPALSIEVAPGENKVVGAELLSVNGFKFTTGIAYAWSTTAGTYTAGTLTDHDTQVFGI